MVSSCDVSYNLLVTIYHFCKCEGLLLVAQFKVEISLAVKSGVESSCFPVAGDLHLSSELQKALYRAPLTYPPPSSKRAVKALIFLKCC